MEESKSPRLQKSNTFLGDVLKLLSGTVLAQLILFLASPLISRLFSPDNLGEYALFSSVVSIFSVVLCLRYDLTINLPKNESDGANLFIGSLGISGLISILFIPLVWWAGDAFAGWVNAESIRPFLVWIPLVLFFGGIGAGHPALNAWVSRLKRFNLVSISRVISAVAMITAQLGLGFWGFRTTGSLIFGALMGSILSPLVLAVFIFRRHGKYFMEVVNWKDIQKNFRIYKKFPIYNTLSSLLNTISWQVPTFMLASFFSSSVVGYYAMGNQVLRAPMDLLGAGIGQAFYAHAATAFHEGHLADFVESTFKRLVEYSFFPILLLSLIGKDLFVLVFGAKWAEAGVYAQILGLWTLFWFISSPLSRLLSILGKNEYSLVINLVILVTRIAAIWLGGVMGDARLAIIFFSISGALVYGFLSVSILVMSGVSWRNIGKTLLNNIILFIPAGAFLAVLKINNSAGWVQVMMAAFFAAAYFAYRFRKMNFRIGVIRR
jgi:O-antigen/teichoic acid export membrane protein